MPDALPKDRGIDDLAIALTYYSPYVSGLTNMARDIAEGLAARGRTVTVVTSHFDSGLPLEEEINGVRVLRAPVLARVGRGVVSPQLVALGRKTLGRARVASLQLPMLEAGAIAASYLAIDGSKAIDSLQHPEVERSAALLIDGLAEDLQRIRAGIGLAALGAESSCTWCAARGVCRRDHWSDAAVPAAAR